MPSVHFFYKNLKIRQLYRKTRRVSLILSNKENFYEKIIFAAFLLSPLFSFAASKLDGTRFCRTVVSDGSFGQPSGESLHCVYFAAGRMTDTANTFSGNPP